MTYGLIEINRPAAPNRVLLETRSVKALRVAWIANKSSSLGIVKANKGVGTILSVPEIKELFAVSIQRERQAAAKAGLKAQQEQEAADYRGALGRFLDPNDNPMSKYLIGGE